MTKRSATASRILHAARKLFNVKGYSATSVTEIAASLGISQGNLTYHFKTKQALAMAIEDDLLQLMQQRRAAATPGSLAEDYIEHVMFGMEVTWRFRFVLRDRPIYAGDPIGQRSDSQLTADLDDLKHLLERMAAERMFVEAAADEIETLARSLWMVSRYWIDYLKEVEGLAQPDWSDQQRGIGQHLALLMPHLRAPARRELEQALARHPQDPVASRQSAIAP